MDTRRGGCSLGALALAASVFFLALVPTRSGAEPELRPDEVLTIPVSPGYERAERLPWAIPALAESLADVQWREWRFGVPPPDPLELARPFNLPDGDPAIGLSLVPGALQPGGVETGSLPAGGNGLRALSDPVAAPTAADTQFGTLSFTGAIPPDNALAAGPAHLVSVVNSHLQISTLAGAHLATVALRSFFPTDPTGNLFDPRVSYDQMSGRFILAALGRRTTAPLTSTYVLAVSATSDPTGVWYKYSSDFARGGSPPTDWADFPCLGYDGAAIYLAANMYTFSQSAFTGNRLVIIDKSQALIGAPLTGLRMLDNVMQLGGSTIAATLRPVEAVVPVSPGLMVSRIFPSGLALYKISDPLGTQGAPVITSSFIPTAQYATQGSAPEAGSTTLIDAGDTRLQKTVYANGLIWTCHANSSTGTTGGKSQVVFYKINPAGFGTLVDADAIADSSLHFFLPALVPDPFGNAIAVFAGSSPTTFPSVYSARYNAATGSFGPPSLLAASGGPYSRPNADGVSRWGDYSDASLDVVSSTHVWIQGELATSIDLWEMVAALVASSAPLPPYGLTAAAASSTQINLAWNDNSARENGFKIERRTGGEPFALLTTLPPNSTRYSDTGLTPSKAYAYRVTSFDAAGDSVPSNEASATTLAPPAAGPSALTATPVASTRIQLAWTDNSDNETAFEIERKSGSGAFTTVAVVGANTTSFLDTGLSANTSYTYRVRATQREGASAYSNEATATTPTAGLSLVISPTTVVGGTAATATVALDEPAPAGGLTITLSSDNPGALTVPATVNVPAGIKVLYFLIFTAAATNTTSGTITASLGSASASATLTVRPLGVALLIVGPNPVSGGSPVTGIVVLDAPAAPGDVTVTLSSSDPTLAAPATASLTLKAGTLSQLFTLTTAPVLSSRFLTLMATANGTSKTTPLTVTP